MPGKFGLGRGLEALIPLEEGAPGIQELPVDAIRPNPHQPRMAIQEHELVELALSIQTHGILQPLIVTREGDAYQLVAGERRWRAAKLAGLTTVPVIVKDLAPQQVLELALVENLQRKDLNPLEEANAYRQLIEEFGLTHEEVAQRVGKSRVAITNTLRLLKATDAVKEALLNGRLSEGHARALLALENPEAQTAALRAVLRQGLTVRQTEELVARMLEGPKFRRASPTTPPEVRALESRFQQALGTRVQLRPGRKGGRLVIYYYSDEDLEALYARLVGGTV